MKNKIISVIFLIIMLPLLTSCFDYTELEREILIFTIGVDKIKTGYEVSAETLQAEDYGGQLSIKPQVITSTGVSIYEALSKLDGKFNNKVNLSHCGLIIVGEEYAREDGINDILNLVFEENNLRFNTTFTTTYNSTAKEILNSSSENGTFHGFEILEQLSKNKLFNDSARAYKVINAIENQGIELTLPVIKRTNENEKKNFYANKIAVFKSDKLLGYIEDKDVNYYSFLLNKKDSIQLKLNNDDSIVNTKISLNKTKDKIENNKLNIKMDINAYIESNDNNISQKQIEKELEKQITKEIYSFINITQKKFKVDIFGYGFNLNNKKIKNNHSDWNDYFINLSPNVKINVQIKEMTED
ncbi:Ger(x)C family spore germination protein [Anaerofustis butyriciformans]|uniref:Ger(x)C family spore germination protein n=1 Tax=Anaerofustis butyriciformans TaxID=3108533 RepID=UPI003F8B5D27